MISLIQFEREHIVERDLAIELNVVYNEILSLKLGYIDDRIDKLSVYSRYKDEVSFNKDMERYIDEKGNAISSYNLYDKLSERDSAKDLVILNQEQLVDLTRFAPKCQYPFKILKTVPENNPNDIISVLTSLEDKVESIITRAESIQDFNFNSKCNVHIGGGLLVTFNDIKLLEDSCSDILQEQLNYGWRIIAICVQPDQRRPDYILGRYNPNLDTSTETSAKR